VEYGKYYNYNKFHDLILMIGYYLYYNLLEYNIRV